jgi:hypothetical protein
MVIKGSFKVCREILERYSVIDLRWLALFRLYISVLAIVQMIIYWQGAEEFLTNNSLYPNHYLLFYALEPGVSLFFSFSDLHEVRVVLGLLIANALWVLIGAGSVWHKVLLFLSVSSLTIRNLWLENGGHVVLNLLALWMIFLPTNERFSLNRYRERRYCSWRVFLRDELTPAARESHALIGILFCLVLIYLFYGLTKDGVTWRTGQAVHYTLWMSDRVTPFGRWLREFAPSSALELLTRATLWIEFSIPALVLFPFRRMMVLRIAGLFIIVLHFGIVAVINLGVFSYAMCGFCPLLFGLGVRPTEPTHSSLSQKFGLIMVVLLMYVQLVQSTSVYWKWTGHAPLWHAPEWTRAVVSYLRIPQNWRMFSPDAPRVSSQVRRFGKLSDTLWDLDTGQPVGNRLLPVLSRTFDDQKFHSILRIEGDSRFGMLTEDFKSFYQQYLVKNYPGYEHYLVVLVQWQSPTPGVQERPGEPQIVRLWQLPSNGTIH